MGEASGLNYTPLFTLLDRAYPDPEQWDEVFDDVREIESAALGQMRKNK